MVMRWFGMKKTSDAFGATLVFVALNDPRN